MHVAEIDTADASQERQFLKLPFQIYTGVPQWVPPLQGEERNMLNHRRNPYFRHSEAAFFLAHEGKEPIGRLAVLDHRPYNDLLNSRANGAAEPISSYNKICQLHMEKETAYPNAVTAPPFILTW